MLPARLTSVAPIKSPRRSGPLGGGSFGWFRCEVKQLMGAIPPEDLTGVEILAVLAILRGAKERVDAQQRPPAAVLELVRPT